MDRSRFFPYVVRRDGLRIFRTVPLRRQDAMWVPGLAWLIAVWLLMVGLAYGQGMDRSAAHELRIAIPNYAGIRIVDAAGMGTDMSSVAFNYGDDPDVFFAAAVGGGTIQPTDVLRFSDIQIRAGLLWSVYVRATPITYVGPLRGAGLGLGDIEVHRGAASGLSPDVGIFYNMDTMWALDTSLQRVARGLLGTAGWKSLGFNGNDYLVRVNGDEDPGEYQTRVTYLLASP